MELQYLSYSKNFQKNNIWINPRTVMAYFLFISIFLSIYVIFSHSDEFSRNFIAGNERQVRFW